MKKFEHTTTFSSVVRPLVSEEKDKYLAMASTLDVTNFIPEIDISKNFDLLPIAFNACVANRVNRNGDVIDTATALDICESFINKPINIEHNRQRVIGTILTAGFSEFGTDSPLPGDEMVDVKSPFNLTLGGIVWKVVNTDLADVIEESNDPTSEHYMKISASWELGFTEYDLLVLEGEEKNIEDAIIISDPEEKELLKENLKIFGGTGELDDGRYVYRKVINTVIPLGIGLTETPAADVKGVFVRRKEVGENLAENNTINQEIKIKENISQTDKNNVIKEKRLAMKIKSLKDITDENLKEVAASAITDFIEDELKQSVDHYESEKKELQESLQAAKEVNDKIEKQEKVTQTELENLKADIAQLVKEKDAKEAEEKFNQRMAHMDDVYELIDEDREVIATDVKDLDDEGFETYQKKMSTLIRHKNKELLAEEAEKQDVAGKAETKVEEVAKAASEANAKEERSDTEAAVEEALENADPEASTVPVSTSAEESTVHDRFARAFDVDQWELRK
jgi:hypothetical protein